MVGRLVVGSRAGVSNLFALRPTSAMNRNALLPTNARPTPLATRPKKPGSAPEDDAEVRSVPFLKRPLVLARNGITSGSPPRPRPAASPAASAPARPRPRPSPPSSVNGVDGVHPGETGIGWSIDSRWDSSQTSSLVALTLLAPLTPRALISPPVEDDDEAPAAGTSSTSDNTRSPSRPSRPTRRPVRRPMIEGGRRVGVVEQAAAGAVSAAAAALSPRLLLALVAILDVDRLIDRSIEATSRPPEFVKVWE